MSITPGTIAVTEGTGKTLDTAAVIVNAQTVQREIVSIGSPDANTPGQYAGVTPAGAVQVDTSVANVQIIDILSQILCQLRLLNVNLSSCIPSSFVDNDGIVEDIFPIGT